MRRRRYLTLAGGVIAGLAGCTAPGADVTGDDDPDGSSGPTDSPEGTGTPTGIPASSETYGYNGAPDLGRIDAAFAQRAVGPYYLAVAAEPTHGERLADQLDGEAGAAAFLRETDYGRASVVCVQDAAASSHPDLAVDAVRTGDGTVTLDLRYPGDTATADIVAEVLLVRVPDPAVEHATVALTGQTGTTTRFSTVGRHGRPQLTEPRPVVVRNRDCEPVEVGVSVTVDGELVYLMPRSGPTPAGSVIRHESALGEAGAHRVAVEAGGARATATLRLDADVAEATGVLVDVAGDGSLAVESRPVGQLPAEGTVDCQPTALPYESPDPAENLDEAVRLTWLNRSDRDVRLGLTVNDDGPVVEREVAMPAGGKGKTEGLIARRGTYETRLSPEPGEGRTVRWEVEERGDDLQVVVEPNGSLSVATDSLA